MKLKPQSDKNKKILEREICEICESLYKTGVNDGKNGVTFLPTPVKYRLDQLLSLFDEKLQEEREKMIEDMKKYNYILYKDEALFFVNAFLDVYREKLKSQEEHEK